MPDLSSERKAGKDLAMSIGYDDPNAPPLDDNDIPFGPGHAGAQPTILLAKAIQRLADSIDHLAVASQARGLPQTSPGGPPAAPSPPSGAPGPPGGSNGDDEDRVRKGKRIYAICAKNCGDGKPTGEWTPQAVAKRITGRNLHWNSQQWDEADQDQVLDTLLNVWKVG